MPMTDDDAYDRYREQMAERGPWPRRTNTSNWLSADDRRHRAEAVAVAHRPWMAAVMTGLVSTRGGFR